MIEDRPELIAAVGPLLAGRKAIEQQVGDLDRKVLKLTRYDTQVPRFMTAPGVGPITALCFKATIDDPTRFKRSRNVGAYVGLTTRHHSSGEVDWPGRISKCGDAMLRTYLFEAANVLLTRVPKWSALKAWGIRTPAERAERWRNIIGPVFQAIWPLDVELQTSVTTFKLVQLLRATGDAFPEAAGIILPFIRPEEKQAHATVYSIAQAPIEFFQAAPSKVLDLLAAVVGDPPPGSVHMLGGALSRLKEAAPDLVHTRKFQKLQTYASPHV